MVNSDDQNDLGELKSSRSSEGHEWRQVLLVKWNRVVESEGSDRRRLKM